MRKLIRLVGMLAVVLIATFFIIQPTEVKAAQIDSGTCGANLTWKLTDDGTLTISGTGNMTNYASYNSPWYEYSDEIKEIIVEEGVRSVGNYAFALCDRATIISLPSTITKIGEYSFYYCESLITITIPDNVRSIPEYAFNYCTSLQRPFC